MKNYVYLTLMLLMSAPLLAQQGIDVPQMSHCDNLVTQFMNQFNIPSATLAIAKDGKMVYMKGFGNADINGTEPTTPHHMFRIASVSKPITAIAIYKMIEGGQLNLSDKVFGPNGIFANNAYFNAANITDNRIYDITVQQLLEHGGGFDRGVDCVPNPTSPYAWDAGHCDPIGFPLHVAQVLGESNPVSEQALIRFLLEKGLNFTPGTDYKYSNIGYLTLGLIIEEISGLSYEDYVKTNVLAPIGIHDMYIGRNLQTDKREREGEYVGNGFNVPSAYGTGALVPWEYGGWNLEAMDAHGGWIATARDLVRLLVAVDGFNTKPDILSQSSINSMVSPGPHNNGYSKGWSVNQFNNWWHTGALDGTASIWVRSSGGMTWALILNKRIINANANNFWSGLDNLPWNCVLQTNSFPTHDLFDFPAENAFSLSISDITETGMKLSWNGGTGEKKILVAREGGPVVKFPLDGTDYAANPAFGQGDDLGDGMFVVFNGSGTDVNLTGLAANKHYHFRLFDYNQNSGTGNHALYQLHQSPEADAVTGITSLQDLQQSGIRFFPNPAKDQLQLNLSQIDQCDEVVLTNLQGKKMLRQKLAGLRNTVSLANLPSQMYIISFYRNGQRLGSARLVKLSS